MMRNSSRFFGILAVLSLAVGCANKDSSAAKGPAAAGAQETKELVVYTYDAFPKVMQEKYTARFRSAYGVEVRTYRFRDAGGLYNQLYLERSRPKADAMIGLDTTYLTKLSADALLAPYAPAGFKIGNEKLLPDPKYGAIPFDYGGVLLNYDKKKLPDPPRSWKELQDPKYKGKIVLMNPGTSSPGRNFLLLTVALFGEDGYLDFWRKLKPNVLTVTAGWSEGYGLYTQGEAPIVLSYDTSPAYHIEYEKSDRYDNLVIDDRAYAQIEIAGILNAAANRKNAERFMDYIVSAEFQELIPLNQFMYPVNPDVRLPESFLKVKRPAILERLDEGKVAANFDKWLEGWESVMK